MLPSAWYKVRLDQVAFNHQVQPSFLRVSHLNFLLERKIGWELFSGEKCQNSSVVQWELSGWEFFRRELSDYPPGCELFGMRVVWVGIAVVGIVRVRSCSG